MKTLALSVALSAALASGATWPSTARAESTLRLGLGAEPTTLDPALAGDKPSNFVIIQLYEGLVTFDPVTMAVKPGVANSWTISAGGKKITLRLNPAAKWSNGRAVNAMDFVQSWRRVLDPKTGSRHASHLFPIAGAEELYKSKDAKEKAQAEANLGVKALGPRVLEITLKTPMPHFMQLLATKYFYALPFPEMKAQAKNVWKAPETLITNGAYKLKSRVFQKDIVLTKNPGYWNKAQVAIDTVRFKPVADASVEENYFRTGKLDLSYSVPGAKAKVLHQKKDPTLAVTPFFATSFIALNCAKPPLDNPKVRAALSLAIDRHAITDSLLGTGQIPVKTLVPSGIENYPQPKPVLRQHLAADIAKAQKLLAEAGYPNGKGFPKVTVLYHTHEDVRKLLVAIQSMWRKNLNIEVKLHNEEWRVFLQNFKKKNYTIARGAWAGNYADPTAFLNMFRSEDVNNRTNWSSPEYQRLLDTASVALNPKKRLSTLAKAERLMLDEHPIIPLYQHMRLRLISPKVKIRSARGAVRFAPSPLDTVYIKDLVLIN